MRSVHAGAMGVSRELSAKGWDARTLRYAVREPFPSRTTWVSMIYGQLEANESLRLSSRTPEGAAQFSDGIVSDSIDFNAGSQVTIRVAETQGQLVVS